MDVVVPRLFITNRLKAWLSEGKYLQICALVALGMRRKFGIPEYLSQVTVGSECKGSTPEHYSRAPL